MKRRTLHKFQGLGQPVGFLHRRLGKRPHGDHNGTAERPRRVCAELGFIERHGLLFFDMAHGKTVLQEQAVRGGGTTDQEADRADVPERLHFVHILGDLAVDKDAVARQGGAEIGPGREEGGEGLFPYDLENRENFRVPGGKAEKIVRVGARKNQKTCLYIVGAERAGRGVKLIRLGERADFPGGQLLEICAHELLSFSV